jgi:hypothetical protein
MPLDLHELAQQLTSGTPRLAAEIMARLFKAVLDALPHERAEQSFLAAFYSEMAKLHFRVERDPRLTQFYRLKVGDEFRTPNGRRFRRIAPVPDYDYRDQFTLYLEALDPQNNQLYYFSGPEVVERIEPDSADNKAPGG